MKLIRNLIKNLILEVIKENDIARTININIEKLVDTYNVTEQKEISDKMITDALLKVIKNAESQLS